MRVRTAIPWAFAGLMSMLCLTGCPPKRKLSVNKPEQLVENKDAERATSAEIQINQDWTDVPQLAEVHFDFDKADLSQADRTSLKSNVAFFNKLPASVMIRVEGHCDDRGTVEYNFALGQRRASIVRSYYAAAGIPKARIETISFGQEHPVCKEENENCWARNRRSATQLKNNKPLTINAGAVAQGSDGSPNPHELR